MIAALGRGADLWVRLTVRGALAMAVAACVAFPAHAAGADAVTPGRQFYAPTAQLDASQVTDLRTARP